MILTMCRWMLGAWIALVLLLGSCGDDLAEHAATRANTLRGGSDDPTTLTVFAAASLQDAFVDIEQAFEARHPTVDVVLNVAGSQQLAQQLRLGAPGDVFASANQRQMQVAVEAGRVDPAAPRPFASNRLAVAFPSNNPAGIDRVHDLAQPGLRLVIAAAEVPAGRYTRRFLDKASQDPAFGPGFKAQVLDNVVSFEQNVRAVLTKVELGEADAGIVYASDVVGDRTKWLEVPAAHNVVATYPIAPVLNSDHPADAQAFVDFVLSAEGQELLAQYALLPGAAS